jgi:hypothetical protein
MRILDLNLYLSSDDYSPTEAERFFQRDFAFSARFICHYLRRFLKTKKTQGDGFSNVCFVGHRRPKDSVPYMSNFSKALMVEVPFDVEQYESVPTAARTDFHLRMLGKGIEQLRMVSPSLADDIVLGIEQFRSSGCVDRWRFKEKSFKALGLRVRLDCEMSSDKFKLTFNVLSKDSNVVFSQEILETSPDETCFHYRFKDVVEMDATLVVMDGYGSALYSWRPGMPG